MSKGAEIKEAIDHLPPAERAKLEALLWAEWDWPLTDEADPPQLREKLESAAKGHFVSGSRENIDRILKSIE